MFKQTTIFNEDCIYTMQSIEQKCVDVILTSPPYNMTHRKGGYADKENRYDSYNDWKKPDEYVGWIIDVFKGFDRVLNNNGTVLFNFSYSIENPSLPFLVVAGILEKTNFTLVDTIVWKKPTAIPHPASYNRLNRIYEFVFVFARKSEIKTFKCNKPVVKTSPKGQKYYKVVNNYIEAKNNDMSVDLNKATFSTELCLKLLSIYAKPGDLIYDPFIGTGTSAVAAIKLGMKCIGSEISKKQVDFSNTRISNIEPIICS